MDFITIIGTIAAVCTTSSFIPQFLKTWKMKETRDISLLMYLVMTTGTLLWLIYGIGLSSMPIIVANSITLILEIAILSLKFRYG